MPMTELSCDQVELDPLLDTDHEFDVSPHVTVLDSSFSDDSIDSLRLLECSPRIINDLSTPDVSALDVLEKVNEDEEQVSSNSLKNYSVELEQALLSAGYQISTVKSVINPCLNDDHVGSRPKTHIFSQGRVYTYPKLEIDGSGSCTNVARTKTSLFRKAQYTIDVYETSARR